MGAPERHPRGWHARGARQETTLPGRFARLLAPTVATFSASAERHSARPLSLSKSSHRTAPLGALSDFERSSRPTPRARARIQGAPENPRGRQAQCCRDIRSQHGLCELIEFNAHEACTGARGKRSRLRSSMVERECHKATMPDAADVRHASERTHQQRLRSASEIGSASYRQRRLLMAPAIRLKSCPDLRLRSATTSCTEEAGTVSTEPAFACFRVARSVGRCC